MKRSSLGQDFTYIAQILGDKKGKVNSYQIFPFSSKFVQNVNSMMALLPPLPPSWVILGLPILTDPHPGQQHSGPQDAVLRQQEEGTFLSRQNWLKLTLSDPNGWNHLNHDPENTRHRGSSTVLTSGLQFERCVFSRFTRYIGTNTRLFSCSVKSNQVKLETRAQSYKYILV